MPLTVLDANNPDQEFPTLNKALSVPDGLLAIGGCLSKKRLLNAYRHGVFPWFNPDDPILWWSPDPRLVLFPHKLIISRSLKKTLRKAIFSITFDQAFDDVINACAQPRQQSTGTWITSEMDCAYRELHQLGMAHSVEAWCDDELVGGLYGVAIGQVFFGESMFHTQTDASKVAFIHLIEQFKDWGYQMVDCQVHTNHLASLGAEEIKRDEFKKLLTQYCDARVHTKAWQTG
jgi:leucyl/phenylalanyl-tRNA---protein transferase